MGGGGAQRIMLTLAQAIAERGYLVDLVLVRAEGPNLDDVPASVRIIDLACRRIVASLPKLGTYLRHERPAALMSFLSPVNCVATWARKLAAPKTRLVISERSTFSTAKKSATDRLVLPWLMRWSYPSADALVAISNGVAEDICSVTGVDPDRVKVIYNPAYRPEIADLAHEPLDHPWFREGAPPVLLGVGRLTAQKDFPTLIRAFAAVRAQRPTRLMILGEGEDRGLLMKLIADLRLSSDVALPGFEKNPFAYMQRSAVFVLSSLWEGFGNVLVEAMALGTPVVSTNCPSGPAEILEEGRWGKLVPVGNPTAMAQAILDTLSSPMRDARSRARDFSVDRIVDSYLSVLAPDRPEVK
jgi:glycosyltransferase involved in cell wall biosynthesis